MSALTLLLGSGDVVAWRLDPAKYGSSWDSGQGAFVAGGRWNSAGIATVYMSLDPATAILEVAVHKGFHALDTVPHVLTAAKILDAAKIQIVRQTDIPNPNWLRPGFPGSGQQLFGDALLLEHPFVLIPSVVSHHSWNLMFSPAAAAGLHALQSQEPFALDTRLNPPQR